MERKEREPILPPFKKLDLSSLTEDDNKKAIDLEYKAIDEYTDEILELVENDKSISSKTATRIEILVDHIWDAVMSLHYSAMKEVAKR